MDAMLERLNRIYPNSKYVYVSKYTPEQWIDKEYNSKFDNKAALNRWKSKPLSFEEAVDKANEGYRIGWIVPRGMCVIDIDNNDDPNSQNYLIRLLDKFEVAYSYNYTSKGIHIVFTDPSESIKSDSVTKCGINIAIDTRANETGYIILPTNDPHRKWGQWNDVVEQVPYFLTPIVKDTTPSFIGLTEGDGRNNVLFKWRSKLEQSHKLTDEQIEKCIRIINENLFDTPMTNQELFKTVLREHDKKDKPDVTERENIYNKLSEELCSKYDIISLGANFYMFNGLYYKPISDLDMEKIIHFDISKNLNDTGRKEIIKFLRLKTQIPLDDFDKDWHKIACKNGILNLVTGEITVPTKMDINTIFIPFNYNNDPKYSPRIDQFMKDVCDGDFIKMQFLYQIAGYCLLKKNMFQKFFLFKGEGGTGKSTYMNLIHMMVGGDVNCAHVGLADFDKDYYLATLLSKLVNIDDDVVDGKALENTGRFKSTISGDIISVRQIYQPVISFKPYCTCIFSCNKLPKIMDKTSGLLRRIVLVELNHKVAKPDPLFMNKITEEDMEYFLFKAVDGIMTAIKEGHFRIEKSDEELLKLFQRRQSPINEWLYDSNLTLGDLQDTPCLNLYPQFTVWCTLNGYTKPMNMFSFKEEICALYNMTIEFKIPQGGVTPKAVFYRHGEFDPEFKPF